MTEQVALHDPQAVDSADRLASPARGSRCPGNAVPAPYQR